ncbi:WD40 repeat domain-containing protein [Runella aurantiaca]|uniref:WD40 repeat domain-containing protein n=1 Tax=Runella aurantiaca TaxID=2282308 RepID=A0A369I456_9BACT|nr:WD40 repeat domain-containing protein [Runella aurantiaca]RDB03277.1 WD40 repeat domain-containing protein [Runella aurantiaca]
MKNLSATLGMALLSVTTALAQKPTIEFNARGILALSDGDMAASASVDGKLLKQVGVKDALTVYPLPLKLGQDIGSSPVPNSAFGWTRNATITSDGRYAYVIESRAQTTDSLKTVKSIAELPSGINMYIVDISNLAKPSARKVPVGKNPTAVDMLGSNLLITSEETGKELRLFEIGAGGLPTRNVPIALNLQNARATDVTWHPDGEFVAITVEETKEIWLFKAKRNAQNKIATFEPFGTPAKITGKPGPGAFTPDGTLFIVSDLKDGSAASELTAIQFNTTAEDPKTAEHKVLGSTAVGIGAESFSISPDGTTIVTANKNASAQPWEGSVGKATLSLLTLAKDGKMAKVADYDLDGIAPESVIFDKTGDNLAVSLYEYFDYGNRDGGIEFFKVTKGGTPALTKQLAKISAPKGCYTVKIIP